MDQHTGGWARTVRACKVGLYTHSVVCVSFRFVHPF
jgi:hypothetical protein